MKKHILLILMCIPIFYSCDDLFSPANENFKDLSQMHTEPSYAQGFLMNSYSKIPNYYDNSDYATDDAVTNQKSNNYLKIATGSWTADYNPLNQWTNGFNAIQYINLFYANVDQVKFVEDESVNTLMRMRMKGEAHGMRALHMYYLLRSHAGFSEDGRLLGVPILKEFEDVNDEHNLPRATFEECIQQIYSDLDMAEDLLPMEYNDLTSDSQIPDRYQTITTKYELYNRAMGKEARQLFNGLIAKSFRSKVALLAASPAFQDASNTTTWADAADYSGSVIDYAGGIGGLATNGHTFYANAAEIDALAEGVNPKEIIWRNNIETNNSTQESQNFPPSLFGTGYMNPTQNLVDAFPMANGYPISNINSAYDDSNPYSGRDPRLAMYIIYNGSTAGANNATIYTGSLSGTEDGVNVKETSTRTGYYMKKRLRMDVNRNPSSVTGKTHYNPRIRYTEIYLNYAEAANEAWGPTGVGSHNYSAYDVVKAIRLRAGVGTKTTDAYLDECKMDKEKMRELIRNERRLELCFEGFRFWDIRRWKIEMNQTARGVNPNNDTYLFFDVESRLYKDNMHYGPIPYSEILKYDNLVQNKGW